MENNQASQPESSENSPPDAAAPQHDQEEQSDQPSPSVATENSNPVKLQQTRSTPNIQPARRSSSVPPGRRSMKRRASTSSIGRSKLKDILASDADSIVDLYEKSRASFGSSAVAGTSRRSSMGAGRLSMASVQSGDSMFSDSPGGRLDARRARKMAHEQAVALENRVSRLKRLEDMYKKRIEQTTKQASSIRQNKDRHQKDLIEKYKQKLKKREQVKKLARKNARKASERKRSVHNARQKCLLEKRRRVKEEQHEREKRKQQRKEEEKNLIRKRRKRIQSMSENRQSLRVKRKQSFSNQMQQKYMENTEHVAFEAQLRQKLNARSDVMCDKEVEMIDRLKKLEAEQKKAVEQLQQALS